MRFTPVLMALALLIAVPTHAQEALSKQEQEMIDAFRKQYRQAMGRAPTAEEEKQFLGRASGAMTQMLGGVQGMRQAAQGMQGAPRTRETPTREAPETSAASARLPDVSSNTDNANFRSKIAALASEGDYIVFGRMREGFTVGGEPHLDADGAIVDYGADPATGVVTYLVDIGGGEALVKVYGTRTGQPPILAGRLRNSRDRVSFESVTGETAGGDYVIPTSRGLLFTRTGSAVTLDWQSGTSVVAIPDSYAVAPFQNGDVGSTRTLLLESLENPEKLSRSFSGLMDAFGKSNISDYAFFNLDTRAVIPLQVHRDRNKARFDTVRGPKFRDSIYDQDGRPNFAHYFWTIQWVNSKFGPVAAVMEAGRQQVNVIRLAEGTRHNAFKRGMGIQYFATKQQAGGDVTVVASWAFKDHEALVSDVLQGPAI